MSCINCKIENEFARDLKIKKLIKDNWIEEVKYPMYCYKCRQTKQVYRPYKLGGQSVCYDCYPDRKLNNV